MDKVPTEEVKDDLVANHYVERDSARQRIENLITQLRRDADGLETILKMLPAEPTPEQDEALWSHFSRVRT